MSTNNITGDALISKVNSQSYSDNYDAIFRKKLTEPIKEDIIDDRQLEFSFDIDDKDITVSDNISDNLILSISESDNTLSGAALTYSKSF